MTMSNSSPVDSCSPSLRRFIAPTALGWLALTVVQGHKDARAILRLQAGWDSEDAAFDSLEKPVTQTTHYGPAACLARTPIEIDTHDIADWIVTLQRFAQGEPVDLRSIPLDLSHLTTFGRRVVEACRQVPWGQTTTYRELATVAESPQAARAVGGVMARNQHLWLVPCHRVLPKSGGLGGFSAPQGISMKARLLAMERGNHWLEGIEPKVRNQPG